ncbi:MAG: hypothetical protein ABI197_00300 [Granulicella sp.]
MEIRQAQPSAPFRWKLFLMILCIMGALTAAAIILTVKAHPAGESISAPTTQPLS